jgi:DNA-binding response OmpR family regulator
MQPEVFAKHESRTLLVDAAIAHGGQLVEQLNHAGFKTDFAVSWGAAHTALKANYYNSCIVVANVYQPADRERLDELRRAAPSVWMILLSDYASERVETLAHREGLDAILSAPFSMDDLTSRLAAFSLRARPNY